MSSPYKPGRPSRQNPPKKAGEYRFRDKQTGKIEYIGMTNDLNRRKAEHLRSAMPVSDDTHHFEWKKADGRSSSRTRGEHERLKIDQHNPSLNSRRGGGGRKG